MTAPEGPDRIPVPSSSRASELSDRGSEHLGRWTVARQAPLIWRSWDDEEYVVYSPASGDTHLVNEVTAVVLRHLERSELELHYLIRSVAEQLGTKVDRRFETYVARLLVYLDQIGLVEPVP